MDDLTLFLPPDVFASPLAYATAFVLATLIIGVAKGGFGGGIGMISVPVMLQVAPATTVLPLLLPILIACDVCTIRHFPHEWDKKGFFVVAPGMVVGLFVGLFCLDRMRAVDINMAIALLSLVFCVVNWTGLGDRPLFTQTTFTKGTIVGLACGVSTMVAHSAGAIVSMFLLSRRLDKAVFIGTTARFYFTFNVLKVPFLALNPSPGGPTFDWSTLLWASWVLPLCPLGVWMGVWMQRRFSQRTFVWIIYTTLLLIAIKLIWSSLHIYIYGA